MLTVLVKSPSIHIRQAVANSMLLIEVSMRSTALLLKARMLSLVPHRIFFPKFVANFYRLDEFSICVTFQLYCGACNFSYSES